MANDSERVATGESKVPTWTLVVAGAVLALFGAIGLWRACDAALHSVAITARVLEHHATSARSRSIVAEVEIDLADGRPSRVEIYDGLGMGTWEDAGTVQLSCMNLRSNDPQCELDSVLDRWLVPVMLFVIGTTAIWWWWHKFGSASSRSKPS